MPEEDYRSPYELRRLGCTCEFGCSNCGMHESQMGNCPSWDPCPIGRNPNPECPVHRSVDNPI
jgi:hypothetical protein